MHLPIKHQSEPTNSSCTWHWKAIIWQQPSGNNKPHLKQAICKQKAPPPLLVLWFLFKSPHKDIFQWGWSPSSYQRTSRSLQRVAWRRQYAGNRALSKWPQNCNQIIHMCHYEAHTHAWLKQTRWQGEGVRGWQTSAIPIQKQEKHIRRTYYEQWIHACKN